MTSQETWLSQSLWNELWQNIYMKKNIPQVKKRCLFFVERETSGTPNGFHDRSAPEVYQQTKKGKIKRIDSYRRVHQCDRTIYVERGGRAIM